MKKKHSILILFALAFLLGLSSCATKKGYGCPEHISIEKLVNFIK